MLQALAVYSGVVRVLKWLLCCDYKMVVTAFLRQVVNVEYWVVSVPIRETDIMSRRVKHRMQKVEPVAQRKHQLTAAISKRETKTWTDLSSHCAMKTIMNIA